MSFADRLIAEPQREKSGETGYERFDYQALWGLPTYRLTTRNSALIAAWFVVMLIEVTDVDGPPLVRMVADF